MFIQHTCAGHLINFLLDLNVLIYILFTTHFAQYIHVLNEIISQFEF